MPTIGIKALRSKLSSKFLENDWTITKEGHPIAYLVSTASYARESQRMRGLSDQLDKLLENKEKEVEAQEVSSGMKACESVGCRLPAVAQKTIWNDGEEKLMWLCITHTRLAK